MGRLLSALIVLALLVLPQNVRAQDLAKGFAAYERKDYATALEHFRPLAEQGNAEAQYYLGEMYLGGSGLARNSITGVKWTRLSAEQGLGNSYFNLGFAYHVGSGVPKDFLLAYKWYNLASGARTWSKFMSEAEVGQMAEDARLRNDAVGLELSRSEEAEGQRMTREWLDAHPQ